MKHFHTFLLFCLFTFTPLQAQDKQLLILHTNDTHSCILPLKETLADTMIAGRAGYLRRVALVKEERAREPELLLFDSGDFSQGSPYYTLYKGDVEVDLMNQMHYDAATIGNHEFDFGLENMARIFRRAEFPIVCANYDFTGTPCEGIVKPYVILKRRGVKIGVFGLAPELDGLVEKSNSEGVRFLNPVEVANQVAKELKEKKKCDLVICLSHLGWTDDPYGDKAVMAQTRNIDLFLGGHSHTYLENLEWVQNLDGKMIGNDQNGKHAVWVGRLILDLKKK
ncbi:MAG: bifunctional metallophosphatase/5'-nucleotidase [Prevotella sp.]|nr:bifunctional metallophosphatase/5'-nucleotidase [Prevotella sp.]